MNNRIKGRRKDTSQKRRESEDKGAVAYCEKRITIELCITRLGCTRFSRNKRVSGKPDAESLQYVTRVSGTRKDHRLEKKQVKPRHQRGPNAVKLEDRSHEETERQEQCAQSKAWDLAKNKYKLKRNDKATFLSHAGKWFFPKSLSKRAGGVRVCG